MNALRTRRLRLVPIGPALIGLIPDPAALAAAIDVVPAEGFPDPDLADLLALHARRLATDPADPEYGPWLVIEAERRVLVGSTGFHGRPWPDGSIEIGFGLVADERGRGYATESAQALLEWARGRPGLTRVIARCEPGNAPSIRVLHRLGLLPTGEAEGLLTWETAL